jgi:phage terminase large subunit-like protein
MKLFCTLYTAGFFREFDEEKAALLVSVVRCISHTPLDQCRIRMNPQVVERLLVFVEPQAKASKSGKDPGRVAKQRAQSLGNHLHVASCGARICNPKSWPAPRSLRAQQH